MLSAGHYRIIAAFPAASLTLKFVGDATTKVTQTVDVTTKFATIARTRLRSAQTHQKLILKKVGLFFAETDCDY